MATRKRFAAPTCPGCTSVSKLIGASDAAYPYHSDYGAIWICVPCQMWVGTHKGTERPLGTLATLETRPARHAAHLAFDPLWQRKMVRDRCSQQVARSAAYRWLAAQLDIPVEHMHISQFDAAMCRRVIAIVQSLKNRK